MAEAVKWGKRGARINTINPGIITTPLAKNELTGPRGEGYRRMIDISAAGRHQSIKGMKYTSVRSFFSSMVIKQLFFDCLYFEASKD